MKFSSKYKMKELKEINVKFKFKKLLKILVLCFITVIL